MMSWVVRRSCVKEREREMRDEVVVKRSGEVDDGRKESGDENSHLKSICIILETLQGLVITIKVLVSADTRQKLSHLCLSQKKYADLCAINPRLLLFKMHKTDSLIYL
jgi:hypothetical protein